MVLGVGEQQHQINFVVGNAGVDLLMTALLVGKQQGNGQTGIVRDQTAGGGRGKQIVLHEDTDVLLNNYALIKADQEQFARLDKEYILKVRRENYGYACLTDQKQYYRENYPDVVVEQGNLDEVIAMMIGGEDL